MTDPTDVTNHLDANGNIVSGVPDFGTEPRDDFQKIAGSRVPRMRHLKRSLRELLASSELVVPKAQLDAALATIARLRGVIEAAVKGCSNCRGRGWTLPPGWSKRSGSVCPASEHIDCRACRELRAAIANEEK